MRPTLVLTRLEQLRALADPLRLRIIQELTQEELTVAELAKRFRAPVARLYHHIDMLLEAGVIEVTRRVPRRGTEERFLRAVAEDYTLDKSLVGGATAGEQSLDALLDVIQSLFDGMMADLGRGASSGSIDLRRPGQGVFLHDHPVVLTPDAFEALGRELPRGVDAVATKHRKGQRRRYRVVVVAYPIDENRSK